MGAVGKMEEGDKLDQRQVTRDKKQCGDEGREAKGGQVKGGCMGRFPNQIIP